MKGEITGHTARGARTSRRVLVVDDEPLQRKLTSIHLANAGFVVRTAGGASEALAAVRSERPDAIVADVLMGEIDGFTLCRMLREEPELADLPIVLVSSHFV